MQQSCYSAWLPNNPKLKLFVKQLFPALRLIPFFACCLTAAAQTLPPEPVHALSVGKNGQDAFFALATADDGRVAVAGIAGRGDFGASDALLLIADQDLEKTFERHIGRHKDDGAYAISTLPGGGWLMAGYSTHPGNNGKQRTTYFGGRDAWLLRLDANGQTRREWIMGLPDKDDEWRQVLVLSDQEALLAGNSGESAWIARIDSAGSVIWQLRWQHFSLPTRLRAATWSAGRKTLYVTGFVEEQGQRRMWVAAIDQSGKLIWEKMWPHAQAEEGVGITVTPTAIFVGGNVHDARGRQDAFVTKLNANGTVLQHTVLGGREDDRVFSLAVLHDRDIVLGGSSKSFQRGSRRDQAWIVQCDTACRLLDEKYYGGKNDNAVYTLHAGTAGGLYAAGFSHSLIAKSDQAWAMQLRKSKQRKPAVRYSESNAIQADTVAKPTQVAAVFWLDPNPDLFDRRELVWPEAEIGVSVKVIAATAVQKQDFCLEINGRPCTDGAKFDEVVMRGGTAQSRTFEQQVRLEEGNNTLRATLRCASGTVATEPLHVVYTPRKPNLHLLAVGVPSPDLRYTTNDAQDFARALTRNNTAFHTVFVDTLCTENNTTKTAVLKNLRRLQYRFKERQIAPNDLVVVFLSSHGLQSGDSTFRIAAGDFDGPFLDETSLDFDREILDYLEEVNCRKLFVIDACLSGAAEPQAPSVSPALIASSHPNLNIFVSCRADELSYEDAQWQNGAFTEAIIQGLQQFTQHTEQIDDNGDRQLSIGELFNYVQKRVPELIQEKRPKTPTNQRPLLMQAPGQENLIIFKQ